MVVPRYPESEALLLAASFQNSSNWLTLRDRGVSEEHYSTPYHKAIWRAVSQLMSRNVTPTSGLIKDEARAFAADIPNGFTGLSDAVDRISREATVGDTSFSEALIKVSDSYNREHYVAAQLVSLEMASNPNIPLGSAMQVMTNQIRQTDMAVTFKPANKAAATERIVQEYRDARAGVASPLRKSGIAGLDKIIRGFKPNDYVIWSARMGQGKSTALRQMAVNCALNADLSQRYGVIIFTMEEDEDEITDALHSLISGVPDIARTDPEYARLLPEDTEERLLEAGRRLANAPIYIVSGSSFTTDQLRAIYRTCNADSMRDFHVPVRVLAIDYIQLLARRLMTLGGDQALRLAILKLSAELRGMAMRDQLNVEVHTAAQLSRAFNGEEPTDKDIAECDGIAQDATKVFAVYQLPKARKEEIAMTIPQNMTQNGMLRDSLIVEPMAFKIIKNRKGPRGYFIPLINRTTGEIGTSTFSYP